MAWTVATVATIADNTDLTTYDSTDTNITLTAGKTYFGIVLAHDAAAEAAGDPSSVGASDGTAAFTKVANGFVYQTNRNISWWYYKPGSTLTGKTFRVVYDDAGTACIALLISIDESTADPPVVVGNIKTATDTDTDVSVTPDALQSASNLQLAASGHAEAAAIAWTGTGWTGVDAGSLASGPSSRFAYAKNDSGAAQAVTATGTGSVGRGISSVEVAAGAAAGTTVTANLADSSTVSELLDQAGIFEHEYDSDTGEFNDVLTYSVEDYNLGQEAGGGGSRYWRERRLRREVRPWTPRP